MKSAGEMLFQKLNAEKDAVFQVDWLVMHDK